MKPPAPASRGRLAQEHVFLSKVVIGILESWIGIVGSWNGVGCLDRYSGKFCGLEQTDIAAACGGQLMEPWAPSCNVLSKASGKFSHAPSCNVLHVDVYRQVAAKIICV